MYSLLLVIIYQVFQLEGNLSHASTSHQLFHLVTTPHKPTGHQTPDRVMDSFEFL